VLHVEAPLDRRKELQVIIAGRVTSSKVNAALRKSGASEGVLRADRTDLARNLDLKFMGFGEREFDHLRTQQQKRALHMKQHST
jgi:hypothetical protein